MFDIGKALFVATKKTHKLIIRPKRTQRGYMMWWSYVHACKKKHSYFDKTHQNDALHRSILSHAIHQQRLTPSQLLPLTCFVSLDRNIIKMDIHIIFIYYVIYHQSLFFFFAKSLFKRENKRTLVFQISN